MSEKNTSSKRVTRKQIRPDSFFRWMHRGIAVIAFSACLFAGAQMTISYIMSQPYFYIQRIVISGAPESAAASLSKSAEKWKGKPILEFDIEDFNMQSLENPWVRQIRTSRVFPDAISVRIVSRVPALILETKNECHLIAADGVRLCVANRESRPGLPILKDYKYARIRRMEKVDRNRIAWIVEIVQMLKGSEDPWLNNLTRFEITASENMICRGPEAFEFAISTRNINEALARYSDWRNIYDEPDRPKRIDLRFQDRIIVEKGVPDGEDNRRS